MKNFKYNNIIIILIIIIVIIFSIIIYKGKNNLNSKKLLTYEIIIENKIYNYFKMKDDTLLKIYTLISNQNFEKSLKECQKILIWEKSKYKTITIETYYLRGIIWQYKKVYRYSIQDLKYFIENYKERNILFLDALCRIEEIYIHKLVSPSDKIKLYETDRKIEEEIYDYINEIKRINRKINITNYLRYNYINALYQLYNDNFIAASPHLKIISHNSNYYYDLKWFFYYVGYKYIEKNLFDDAIKYLEISYSLNKNKLKILYHLIVSYMAVGKYNKANQVILEIERNGYDLSKQLKDGQLKLLNFYKEYIELLKKEKK